MELVKDDMRQAQEVEQVFRIDAVGTQMRIQQIPSHAFRGGNDHEAATAARRLCAHLCNAAVAAANLGFFGFLTLAFVRGPQQHLLQRFLLRHTVVHQVADQSLCKVLRQTASGNDEQHPLVTLAHALLIGVALTGSGRCGEDADGCRFVQHPLL